MLVYGSLDISGMVFSGYDNGFQPSLAFFRMPWYVGMFILVLELWNCKMDFGIQGGGGLKVHSQRPRNPLTGFGEIHGKARGSNISLGHSDLDLDCSKS